MAMLAMGVAPAVLASFLQELKGMVVRPEFENLDCGECKMNACIAQGGVHSTFCWNALFGYVLSLLIPRWNNKGFGFLMSHLTLHHILWSDNVWLIGKDEHEIEDMVKALTFMMGVYGLVWKPGSLLLMRGGAEEHAVEKDMTCEDSQ